MRTLTVLGGTGGYPEPGDACAGFLLEWDGFRLVLDLGYGTLPPLMKRVPDLGVDAVVITHEHPDHCVDLHGLFRARYYGGGAATPVRLYCPPGVLTRLQALEPAEDLADVFEVHPLPGTYDIGPFRLRSLALPHFVVNIGIRLETSTQAIAYTGDTGPADALAELGRAADLFIVDATDRPGETDQAERNLLTAAEAGRWAQRAGAARLLLTHFWPGNDREAAVRAAGTAFAGPVLAAEQGLRIDLDGAAGP